MILRIACFYDPLGWLILRRGIKMSWPVSFHCQSKIEIKSVFRLESIKIHLRKFWRVVAFQTSTRSNYTFLTIRRYMHCAKCAQIRSFFLSVFSCIRTEYRKIRTRKNSVFGHFSRSDLFMLDTFNPLMHTVPKWLDTL